MTPVTRRDSEATRRRLLQAAREEFTARGQAGARVDRIANDARANKAQIYHYFGDKEGLFDAVLEACTEEAVSAVPIDANDLPEYAARLFEFHADHPDLLRLVTWARLEGRTTPSAQRLRQRSYRRRLAAIESAQRDGTVTGDVSAPQILDMIESLAVGWTTTARGVLAAQPKVKRDRAAQRQAIAEAVRRIIDPARLI
jgi:AcrR family transcriptional regulator